MLRMTKLVCAAQPRQLQEHQRRNGALLDEFAAGLKGPDKSAQGRARRRQPPSAALGYGRAMGFALKGQNNAVKTKQMADGCGDVAFVPPFQGFGCHCSPTQGGAPRLSPRRSALG